MYSSPDKGERGHKWVSLRGTKQSPSKWGRKLRYLIVEEIAPSLKVEDMLRLARPAKECPHRSEDIPREKHGAGNDIMFTLLISYF